VSGETPGFGRGEVHDENYNPSEVSLSGGGNFATGYDWTFVINPYIKNGSNQAVLGNGRTIQGYVGGVYACPSAIRRNQQDQFVVRADVFPVWYNNSGALSANASGPSVALAAIDEPANRIGIWEAGSNGIDTNNYGPYYPMDDWAWYSGFAQVVDRICT
jgi:hypothetical protein